MAFKSVTSSFMLAALAAADTEQLKQSPVVGTTWAQAGAWGVLDFSVGFAMGSYDSILSHSDRGCFASAYSGAVTLIGVSNYVNTGYNPADWYEAVEFWLEMYGGAYFAYEIFAECTGQLVEAKEKYADKYGDKEAKEEGDKDLAEEVEQLFATYGASPQVRQTQLQTWLETPLGRFTQDMVTLAVYTVSENLFYGKFPLYTTYALDLYAAYTNIADSVEYFANPEFYFLQDGMATGYYLTETVFLGQKYYKHLVLEEDLDLDEHVPLWFLKPKSAQTDHGQDKEGDEEEAAEEEPVEEVAE